MACFLSCLVPRKSKKNQNPAKSAVYSNSEVEAVVFKVNPRKSRASDKKSRGFLMKVRGPSKREGRPKKGKAKAGR
ncbi:hypothetical protein SAMD00023353_7000340 [Rosellinia necatrix]|uniref:Uncharacterized protein n=1 Tax=Rosellinia necatrix TaxID=77044 RepID=A0A1S8AAG9_ROSNE|nr:hypothetical protein SAMD00023353_7000340 [Rosellinia necatrix]